MEPNELLLLPDYDKLLVGLLAILNPLGALPVFLSLTSQRTPAEKHRIAVMAAIAVTLTLLVFTFLGHQVLELFDISIHTFRIAGGILLLLMALDMMRPHPRAKEEEGVEPSNRDSIGIVPVAIPLLAGPGAISTIIVYSNLNDTITHKIGMSIVILIVAIIVYISLKLAPRLGTMLGQTGMTVFNRIMGLILASVAVEFIIGGLLKYLQAVAK